MPSRLHLLFEKYLNRRCTPQEVEEFVVLLQQAEAEENLTGPMQVLWDSLKNEKVVYDVDWDRMYSSIVKSEDAGTIISPPASKNRRFYLSVAASVILLVGAVAFWLMYHESFRNAPFVPRQGTDVTRKALNNHEIVRLPDNSTVILNAGSKLNYEPVFGKGRRDVHLSGAGFFDIRHIPSRPFFVHAGKLLVKVLGTSFNIRSYPLQKNIEVTVSHGKVQVFREDRMIGTLTANERMLYNHTSKNVSVTKVDTLSQTSWKPAELHFDDVTMQEALQTVEQNFEMEVEFTNPAVKNCRVTATFSEDDMVEEIVAVICAVSKCQYTIANNKIIIDGKGCN